MQRFIARTVAVIVLLALGAAAAHAAGPAAAKCEAGKIKVSRAYVKCMLKVLAKNAVQGSAPDPDIAKCAATFMMKYPNEEMKAGVNVCPTNGDAALILQLLTDFGWSVAKELGAHLPGYRGKRDLDTPKAIYWKDSDGVAPEQAGCHSPYGNVNADCSVAGVPADNLPEQCEADGQILVETNPGAGVCHDHPGHNGRPVRYHCNSYCLDTHGVTGSCETLNVMSNNCLVGGQPIASAHCECNIP